MSSRRTVRPTILIVDDEPLMRTMIRTMLTRAGYAVDTAGSGREALDKAKQTRPDLITLDYMMPDLSGLEVLEQLSLDPATAAIPVLIVSAVIREEELTNQPICQQMQVDFLPKPVQLQQLVDHIERLLAASHSDN